MLVERTAVERPAVEIGEVVGAVVVVVVEEAAVLMAEGIDE